MFPCLILAAGVLLGNHAVMASSRAPSPSPLIIGLLLPPAESDAPSLREGVLLGVQRAQETAKRPVRVVIRGRNGPWGSDASEAAQLVMADGAQGLIAPAGGAATHLVLQVAGRTAVPVVSLCPDASVTRTGVPWTVRIVPRAIEEARALFSGLHAAKAAPNTRWVAVVPEGRAGEQPADDLKAAARDRGCHWEPPLEFGLKAGPADVLCRRVLQRHPDAVLLWLDTDAAARLAKSLRAEGFTGFLAGPGWLGSPAFAARAGKAAEGFVVPSPVTGPRAEESRRRFSTAFRRRFGHQPDPTAAMACDATTLLVHVLLSSGSRPARFAFPLRRAVPGVTGWLRFDRDGNRLMSLRLERCHGGSFAARDPRLPEPSSGRGTSVLQR